MATMRVDELLVRMTMDDLMLDELPDILVKQPGKHLTALQIAHVEFLYTRTPLSRLDICALMDIEMSTLERLVKRKHMPLRQPDHWTQRARAS